MKIITLNESQFKRLFENNGIENYGNNGTPDNRSQEEVGINAKIDGSDGNTEDSRMANSDEIQRFQTQQAFGTLRGRQTSSLY